MVDTLDASINKMKTLQTEARGVDSAFADVRQRVQSLDIELLKSVKVANKLAESFKKAADNIFGARQEMHDLQNRVFKTTNLLKDMDGQLNRVGLGLENNTDETQKVVVESANYTEVLEKMASSLEKMEDRQKKMRIATIKQRKEQEKATKAAKEAAEASNKLGIVAETLGLKVKNAEKGIFEMTNEAGDGVLLLNKYGQEVTRVGDVVTDFNKRTTVLTKTIIELNKVSGSTSFQSFQVIGKGMRETLKVYRQQGGNVFEFLAEGLSGTREEITLFGIEGAKFRKVLYGFFPPGAFRLINKFSSGLQLMGGIVRKLGGGSEEAARRLDMLREQKQKLVSEGVPLDDSRIGELDDAMERIAESAEGLGGGKLTNSLKGAFKKLQGFDIFGESIKGFKDLAKGPPPTSKAYAGTLGGVKGAPATTALNRRQMIVKQMKLSSKILGAPVIGMLKLGKIQLELTRKAFKNIIPVMKMAGRFFMSALLYLVLFFMVFTLLKKPIMEGLKFLMGLYKLAFIPILAGLKNIFSGFYDIYQAFKGGDIFKLFEGVGKILFGIVQIGIGLIMAWVGTVPALLGGFLYGVYNFFKGQYNKIKEAFRTEGPKAAMKAAVFIVAAIAAFTIGLPAILAIAAVGLIYGLAKAISNSFEGGFKGLLGFKASGGQINTPLTVVGERGPELLVGGRGANVISNQQSRNLVGGSSVVNYNITVNAKDTSKAEMRRMADEIGRMINSKINRSTSSSTFR